jgi:16S rRNA (cytosine967-C5)-methyltransferase
MRKSSLIGHVAELLDNVIGSREPADSVVREFYRKRHYLGSRDRRYVSETLFGILRNYRLLDSVARRAIPPGSPLKGAKIPTIALCAAYALKLLGEKSVDLLPDIAGLWRVAWFDVDCPAFLKLVEAMDPLEVAGNDPEKRLALETSMPDAIVHEWVDRFGEAEAGELCRASNRPAPTTIRVNSLKCTLDECRKELLAEGVATERTALSPIGLILDRRINTLALSSFRRGYFELQDEGSQLIAVALEPRPGSTVVDACAGGGGKTLHIAAMMGNTGEVIAMDVGEQRLRNLRERAQRAGVTIARTLLAGRDDDIPGALIAHADAVLVDAPCSGVGTFRRNPGAKLTFSDEFVTAVTHTQRDLLSRYAALVKPGGRLVYSTCTLLRRENEEIVERFVATHPDFSFCSAPDVLRSRGVAIPGEGPFLMLLPHRTSTDGFFASVMMRR